MSKRRLSVGTVMAIVVGIAAVAVALSSRLPDYVSRLTYAAESGRADAARDALQGTDNLTHAFKYVANALRPSVVSVHSVTKISAADRGLRQPRPQIPNEFQPFFGDDLFDRFFQAPPLGDLEQRGLGSGVIVSEDGYLVTNNHVVRGATELKVTLSDGRTFDARQIGADAKTDLAVLKIEASDLKPAQFGNSDQVEVGEWVMAVGNPFELQHTVTAGIISAKGRAGVGLTDYEDFLQTDAAINPGNSGGPLVNLQGEVVGINTAIASRNGGYMGVGFAIPSNMVTMIMDSIRRDGRVHRGQLGAMIQDLDQELAESFSFDSTQGVLVGDVVPDTAAEQAGLRAGDIITHFNGKKMASANQLRNTVAATAPGKEVTLQYFRDGKTHEVRVTLGELEERSPVSSGSLGARGESSDALGATVEPLTSALAQQLGIADDTAGLAITQVTPGSLAAQTGMRPGDVLVAAGDQQLNTVEDFRKAVNRDTLSDGVRLQVLRNGVRQFIYLRAGR